MFSFPNPWDLDVEIHKNQMILDLTPEDHPEYLERLTRLGVSHGLRFRRQLNLKDLQSALNALQNVTRLIPDGHPLVVHSLAGLGATFGARFLRFGDPRDLEASIEKNQAAVYLLLDGDPDLPGYLAGLSMVLMLKAGRSGRSEDLEVVIETTQRAISLADNDELCLPNILTLSAEGLATRYKKQGDLEDLQLGIERLQAAVKLTPDSYPDRPIHLSLLGQFHGMRHQRLGDIHDIDSAIQYFQAAVKLWPKGHPGASQSLNDLAITFTIRYSRFGVLDDLISAVGATETAEKLLPAGSPILADGLFRLAILSLMRYDRFRDPNDVKTALDKAQAAISLKLEATPNHGLYAWALADAFAAQYTISGDPDDLKAAFSNYSAPFELRTATVLDTWVAASRWVSLAQKHSSEELFKAYRTMFSLLPETLWIGNSLSARQQEITRIDIAKMTSDALADCIDHHNLALAIEFLDQGLATTFQKILQLKPDLGNLPEADAIVLQDISLQLYAGTAQNPHRLGIQRDKLLAEIRTRPGFKYFLLPRPYKTLRKASENGPIIILTSHESHCDCIILLNPESDPLHIPLPHVTLNELGHQKTALKHILTKCNVRESDSTRLFAGREGFLLKHIQGNFEDLLSWLWKNVVSPIYQALEDNNIVNGRVWWCSTGAFSGLPLHAAAPSDQFISSYTATIGALLDVQALPQLGAPKLGLVGVTHSGKSQKAALPGVKKEIQIVSDLAGSHLSQSLVGEQATVEAVTSQLQQCEWVHLACHGNQDLHDPPKSCLQLYGGILELDTIMKMPLSNPQFVFFAASQTTMGDTQMVNESFHLGAGFIAAGFRGSIGTLWSMRDNDGSSVAETVYTYLFRENTTPKVTDAAKALQLAVRKLRDEGVPYEHWVPFIHMGI
ncbi:CHAT domain-containing protein [Mycena vulgaris]|nr:CHAT domain-containing protein [Mycena vulgaris]